MWRAAEHNTNIRNYLYNALREEFDLVPYRLVPINIHLADGSEILLYVRILYDSEMYQDGYYDVGTYDFEESLLGDGYQEGEKWNYYHVTEADLNEVLLKHGGIIDRCSDDDEN